jgi:hypothetical protein
MGLLGVNYQVEVCQFTINVIDVEGRKKTEMWERSGSLIPFTSIPWEVGTGLQEIRESYGFLGPRKEHNSVKTQSILEF